MEREALRHDSQSVSQPGSERASGDGKGNRPDNGCWEGKKEERGGRDGAATKRGRRQTVGHWKLSEVPNMASRTSLHHHTQA